jgi:hypothetical protein
MLAAVHHRGAPRAGEILDADRGRCSAEGYPLRQIT